MFFFGGNNVETWIKHRKSYHFRCPMCGYQHQPHATTLGDIAAKRVLTITDPLSGNLMHIATENPASEDDKFLNQMIEVTARDIQCEGDLQNWYSSATGAVQTWLKQEAACRSWTCWAYDPRRHEAHVDTISFDVSIQMQRGWVLGSRLTEEEAAKQPFTDFNGFISVFANYVAASRAMALSSRM